jgi:hypothetical protein
VKLFLYAVAELDLDSGMTGIGEEGQAFIAARSRSHRGISQQFSVLGLPIFSLFEGILE